MEERRECMNQCINVVKAQDELCDDIGYYIAKNRKGDSFIGMEKLIT
jgi:hypothetical protein